MDKAQAVIAIIGGILFTGFIAGIFTGISIKTGQDVDPDSLMLSVLKTVCDSFGNMPGGELSRSTCQASFVVLTLVVLVVGIVEIFATASELGNWVLGLGIYFLGWIFGLFLILFA